MKKEKKKEKKLKWSSHKLTCSVEIGNCQAEFIAWFEENDIINITPIDSSLNSSI